MANRLWLLLFITYSCFATAHSCSCPIGSFGKSRDQGIRNDFELSTNVYTAVVSAADCKCYPTNQAASTTRLDCVNYATNDSGVIFESIRKRYECLYGFSSVNSFPGFPQCQDVETTLVPSPPVGKITHASMLNGVSPLFRIALP